MTPGTYPHANVAIGSHLTPVIKASFSIQFPAQDTVDFFLITHWNRVGGAAVRAFFADLTKIFGADIDWYVRDQG